MNMKMKRSLFALLAATVASAASPVVDNQNLLESKVDSINAKRGLELGGSIRGVAQATYFDSDQDGTVKTMMPDVEKDEFVTADLDFHFRPYENVRANATMRLEAGMQEYFESAAKSISVAWINVEGNIGKSFYWIVGDFRQEYTPLTLFLPTVDIMYEPLVFERQRHMAQKSQFIEGNQRNLQGANLQFRIMPNTSVGEIRAEALMARLNRAAVLDFSGAEGNVMTNYPLPGGSQASNMDKWLAAGNFEILPMDRNLYVGATGMFIFDDEESFSYTERHEKASLLNPYVREPINPYDTDAQQTLVVSGRVGGDVAGFLGNKNLTLDAVAEIAMSNDKIYDHTPTYVFDEAGQPVLDEDGNQVRGEDDIKDSKEKGMAILGTVNAGYKTETWGVKLLGNVIYNDSAWFNNAAQSPSFFAQRILNTDLDGNTVKYGVRSPLYSTFGALYSFNPKFSPVARSLGTDDSKFEDGQTESYNIANYNKNSWTTNVYGRSQLALLQTLMDPALQLALPNGLATSNRVGGQGTLTANFKDFAEVQGLVTVLSQVKPVIGFESVKFMEYGGGAKFDIFKALGFSKPLEISGSYKHSERKADLDPKLGGAGTAELKSDFINGGLYVQYLPRLGVTGGVQLINTEYNEIESAMSGLRAPLLKSKQLQWMAGLDYSIEKNAWLAVNFGIITVSNEYNTSALVAQHKEYVAIVAEQKKYEAEFEKCTADGDKACANAARGEATKKMSEAKKKQVITGTVADGNYNLPDYYDPDKETNGKYKNEFKQFIIEASLNVEF